MEFSIGIDTCEIDDVKFHLVDDYYCSIGFAPYTHHEIKISKNGISLEGIIPILVHLVPFIKDNPLLIKRGEALNCLTWSISFLNTDDDGFWELCEAYYEVGSWSYGLATTLKVFKQQWNKCRKLDVKPDLTDFDQTVLVDPLVRTGLQPNLFRWKKEGLNSGWVAITSEYKGAKLEQLTIGKLMLDFEQAIPFMALPAGFKVIWDGNDTQIGFDDKMTTNKFKR